MPTARVQAGFVHFRARQGPSAAGLTCGDPLRYVSGRTRCSGGGFGTTLVARNSVSDSMTENSGDELQ